MFVSVHFAVLRGDLKPRSLCRRVDGGTIRL
jgi:hypothetical protein